MELHNELTPNKKSELHKQPAPEHQLTNQIIMAKPSS